MKIVIRNSTFETNSSSHHTLILTTEKDYKADLKKMTDQMKKDACWGGPHDALSTKQDKALFLAGLFDCDNRQYGLMAGEYHVFIKVLKDNNETELLQQINQNRKDYFDRKIDEPHCCDYFMHGELWDCTCPFSKIFRDYFQVRIDPYLVVKGLSGQSKEEFYAKAKEQLDEQTAELYKKLYQFIYVDGLVVPYEYL
ncbi:MAG: hypothetical protein IKC47_05620 [Clostridia bacterium]|nr:hypothetical protein [Clostridia bacterium]